MAPIGKTDSSNGCPPSGSLYDPTTQPPAFSMASAIAAALPVGWSRRHSSGPRPFVPGLALRGRRRAGARLTIMDAPFWPSLPVTHTQPNRRNPRHSVVKPAVHPVLRLGYKTARRLIALTCAKLTYREALFFARSNNSRRGGPQNAAERGTCHVPRRAAGSGMAQAVTHLGQFADGPV